MSLSQAKRYKSGNLSFRLDRHNSCQNRTFEPSSTSHLTNLTNPSHPLLMNFHKPTFYNPWTSLEYQNFLEESCFNSKPASILPSLHTHNGTTSSLIKSTTFLIPKPPKWAGVQQVFHFTKWNLNSSPILPQKKSLWSVSNIFSTPTGIGKREKMSRKAWEHTLDECEANPFW